MLHVTLMYCIYVIDSIENPMKNKYSMLVEKLNHLREFA